MLDDGSYIKCFTKRDLIISKYLNIDCITYSTDVNYFHQYLDEVKTVGKAFIQLGLRPGSIILMIMIILMITTIIFIFIITITISNQVMALALSDSTPPSGSSQVRDVRPKTCHRS